MENKAGKNQEMKPVEGGAENQLQEVEVEKEINTNVMSIRLSPDGLIFKDESLTEKDAINPDQFNFNSGKLAGVYCQGIQYYDLSEMRHINNTGMATLIDLLKSLLEMGVEVQFMNVDEKIKQKIKEMGLEKIINCSPQKIEKRILL
jgi:ABC-type transporter Mla MlaB component